MARNIQKRDSVERRKRLKRLNGEAKCAGRMIFNRSEGTIGANWSGDTGSYSIINRQLVGGK